MTRQDREQCNPLQTFSNDIGTVIDPKTLSSPQISVYVFKTMYALLRSLQVVLCVVACSVPACAHPHVWITMHTELIYGPDGRITAVRHAWSFDDMFSTFMTQGLQSRQKGMFTREELAPLAKSNIESFREFDYFTYATADGKKVPFESPLSEYWLDYADFHPHHTFHLTVGDSNESK